MPERLKPDARDALGYYNAGKKIADEYPAFDNSYIFRNSNTLKMVVAERRASQNRYAAGNARTMPEAIAKQWRKRFFGSSPQEQPVVLPQVLHFMQVPLRTMVKEPQVGQGSPS